MKLNQRAPFKLAITLLLVLVMSLAWGTAMGQDEDAEEEFMLEEIIVTSEFREKSVQRSPLSISAVSAEMLEERSQVSILDMSSQMPNVSLKPAPTSFGAALIANIRGIGQTDFNPSVEPGVGIYVDDVYYATITGNILELLDLERVEILRGPQGTLAGRNALGGAIKLFSRQPDGSEDGYASVTFGDFNRLDVKAASGFEIVPNKLFMRIAGTSASRDGYIKRYDYACKNNLPAPGQPGGMVTLRPTGGCLLGTEGGQSMTAGRLSLRWLLTDNFEANFAMNVVNDKSESQANVLVAAKDNSTSAVEPPFTSGSMVPVFFDNNGNGAFDDGDVPYDSRFVTAGTYYNYSTYIDTGTSTPDLRFQGSHPGEDNSIYKPAVVPPINHVQSEDYTLSLKWQLSDNTSLLSVTSHREYVNTFAEDADGSPMAVGQLLQRMDHEQFTQELRFNGTFFDGFADLTIGGFYLDSQTDEDARVTINYAAFDFIHGPDAVPATSKAGYGQLGLHLTDRMNLTLGLRYSTDEKSYTFQRHNPDGTIPGAPVAFFPYYGSPSNAGVYGVDGASVSYDSVRTDYRVALDYILADNTMVYGQIATGYRAGGNNARPFFPSQLNAFDPEELTNYEIGVKSTLFNQLRLNASAFFNDYENIQMTSTVCVWAPEGEQSPCASQNNAGDAEVKGFELEAKWQPTRDFFVDFSYSILDFEYTSIRLLANGEPASNITIDMITPYTPENKWSLGAQYSIQLGGEMGKLTPRIDVSYQDEIHTNAVNSKVFVIDSYTVANARLSWRSADSKTEIGVAVTNLTDEYYYLSGFDLWDGAGYISGTPGRPREWAFTVKRLWF